MESTPTTPRPLRPWELGRLENLTEGIFAIAMTILVLNLETPVLKKPFSSTALLQALAYNWHDLLNYAISFYILGSLWVGHNQQLHLLRYTNRRHLWLNLLWLMFICLVPFTASVRGNYPNLISANILIHINLICAGLLNFAQVTVAGSDPELLESEARKAELKKFQQGTMILPLSGLAGIVLSFLAPSWSMMGYLIIPPVMVRKLHLR